MCVLFNFLAGRKYPVMMIDGVYVNTIDDYCGDGNWTETEFSLLQILPTPFLSHSPLFCFLL